MDYEPAAPGGLMGPIISGDVTLTNQQGGTLIGANTSQSGNIAAVAHFQFFYKQTDINASHTTSVHDVRLGVVNSAGYAFRDYVQSAYQGRAAVCDGLSTNPVFPWGSGTKMVVVSGLERQYEFTITLPQEYNEAIHRVEVSDALTSTVRGNVVTVKVPAQLIPLVINGGGYFVFYMDYSLRITLFNK